MKSLSSWNIILRKVSTVPVQAHVKPGLSKRLKSGPAMRLQIASHGRQDAEKRACVFPKAVI